MIKCFFILTGIILGTVNISCQDNQIKLLPPEHGVYHGTFSTTYSKLGLVSKDEIPYFENLTGKKIVWLHFSDEWFKGIKFPMQSVKNIYEAGVIPSIRIMPQSSYNKTTDTVYSLQKIIDGKFDNDLRKWADDARDCGIPMLIDFAAEPNGNWFPWSGIYNGAGKTTKYGDKNLPDGPEKYKDAYKHIINLFRDEKVNNVTWLFHLNAVSAPNEDWNKMKNYYPGDDYIDWIGLSIYGAQRYGDKNMLFSEILSSSYDELCGISSEKPLAILEFGVADYLPGVDKPEWITDALNTVQDPKYDRIKAISWWHSTWYNADNTMSAIQLDSSPESRRAYKKGISSDFFVGTYKLSNENLVKKP